MKEKYEVYSSKTGVTFQVTYIDDTLSGLEILVCDDLDLQIKTIEFIARSCQSVVALKTLAKTHRWQLSQITGVVSFEDFWEAYNYKVGKKEAKDKWNKLKSNEQRRAYDFIGKYNNEVKTTGLGKKYPKTYLHTKIWEE